MSELNIPTEAVYVAARAAYVDLDIHSATPIEAALIAAAPLIVAAELRQLADWLRDRYMYAAAGAAEDRADELDPQGVTK